MKVGSHARIDGNGDDAGKATLSRGMMLIGRTGRSRRTGNMVLFRQERRGQQGLYGRRVGKRSRNGSKVGIALPAHEPEGVQKKDSSFDVNIQGSDAPYARRQLGLGNFIDPAFIQAS